MSTGFLRYVPSGAICPFGHDMPFGRDMSLRDAICPFGTRYESRMASLLLFLFPSGGIHAFCYLKHSPFRCYRYHQSLQLSYKLVGIMLAPKAHIAYEQSEYISQRSYIACERSEQISRCRRQPCHINGRSLGD